MGPDVRVERRKSCLPDSTATILIVDDEPIDRRLLEALLLADGYLTLTAASGEEALVSIAKRAPDLVMLDVLMPGMDGYAVATQLKANAATSSIPIIMLTSHGDRAACLAGLNAGAEEFLTKPIDRAELSLRVRNLLRLKEYSDFLRDHSLILERAVQARTADLQRFRTAMDATADAIVLVNRATMRLVEVNATACKMFGYTREELFEMGPEQLTGGTSNELESLYDAIIAGHGTNELAETELRRKDGSVLRVEVHRQAQRSGADWIIVGVVRDITERKEQEHRIARLSRIHAVLSGINSAIVRIRDRRELFMEACRVAVEHGGFRIGWIATLDHANGTLVPVAQAGLPMEFDAEGASSDHPAGLEPWGTAKDALREKRPAFDNDIERGMAEMQGWHGSDTWSVRREAIRLGARSVIVLPLYVEAEPFAILTLYAPERNFFDDEELKLLTDLAGDISFGLEFIAKDEKVNYLAYYDALTGLANRSLFLERVAQHMRSAGSGGRKLALFLFDLERFKSINDSLGRPAGDALLKQVAEWMTRNAGDADLVARVGADHFAAVLPEFSGRATLRASSRNRSKLFRSIRFA